MPATAAQTVRVAAATFAIAALALASFACAPRIASIEPETALPPWPDAPFPGLVAVEPLMVYDGGFLEGDTDLLQQAFEQGGLAESLRRNRVFARVESDYAADLESDLVIRGAVTGTWDPRASANFGVWFPGGLVLAPNWYGTRQAYRAEALVEVSVRATGEPLGSFQALVDYEVVHRSGSPGPFFGAAIIFPNLMRGIRLDRPRSRYKQLLYRAVHARLWDELAARIAEDPRAIYAAAADAQRARCGDRLDRPAMIGQGWSKFVACQSAYFERKAELKERSGQITSIFLDRASNIQVTVANDTIVHLEKVHVAP
jgi:hypothetical protein